jgi:hypothetical protein
VVFPFVTENIGGSAKILRRNRGREPDGVMVLVFFLPNPGKPEPKKLKSWIEF